MSYLTKLTDQRPDAAINEVIQGVIQQASIDFSPLTFDGEFPTKGFGISNLRPKDVAVTNQVAVALQGSVASSIIWGPTSVAAASTWQDWINLTTDDRIYVIVTGILYPEASPVITAIRPRAGGVDYPVIDIEEIQTYDVSFGWFRKPFAVGPARNLTIRIVGSAAKAGRETIGLLGYTVGKQAYLISE